MSPRSLDSTRLDWRKWPDVNTAEMDEFERKYFLCRKHALCMYVDGHPTASIAAATGIPRQHLSVLLGKAMDIHHDGHIFGFRACRYYARVKRYKRQMRPPRPGTKFGYAGALQQLLEAYPAIARGFRQFVMGASPEKIARLSQARLNKKFEELCRTEGLTEAVYPMNLPFGALSSVVRLVKRWIMEEAQRFAAIRGGARAARKFGSGVREPRARLATYQRVEFDGHLIDGFFTIRVVNPDGLEATLTLERIWLLLVRECATGAILGYHLVLRREYSAEDVLTCIENAIRPWTRKTLTIPSLEYPPGAGLPSGSIPSLSWAVWQELTFDNAAAHGKSIGSWVWDTVAKQIGCVIDPGPVATPDSRLIEGLFRNLTGNGFQTLPGTTGKGPGDPRCANPEKEALAYDVSLDEIEEVLDVYLADFNARPTQTTYGRSPLSALEYSLGQGTESISHIPENKREDFCLTRQTRRVFIRGPLEKGYPLHVNFMHVPYTSAQLSGAAALENTWMLADINTRDLRTIRLSLPNGDHYGVITATRGWGVTKHDQRVRGAIFDLVRKGKMFLRDRDDPIEVYLRHLEEKKSLRVKRKRNMLAHTRRAAERPLCDPIAPAKLMPKKLAPIRPRKPNADSG
ncbi:hypothetical protein DB347_20405 [Opitutaceae bacterium EW11]|nr:hypothetical protein DB347_20405 [Opitutaceae bacterium EW11]